jgi:hypothetical protein
MVIEKKKKLNILSRIFFIGRPSVLYRDDQRTTNGNDTAIDMGSGMYNPSMKQQLQVIDETV